MLDFSSENNVQWFDDQIKKHPEIIKNGILLAGDTSKEFLERMSSGEIQVIIPPGKPIQSGKNIDWDAWYLYYCLCDFAGLKTSYLQIAELLNRSTITVKHNFKEIQSQLDK